MINLKTARHKPAYFGVSVFTLLLVFGAQSNAQQGNVPRIGFLASASASDFSNLIQSYREGLRDAGYIEGKNIVIEYRFAERKLDRVPELAAELVRRKIDVFTVAGTVAATAAKQATSNTDCCRRCPAILSGRD